MMFIEHMNNRMKLLITVTQQHSSALTGAGTTENTPATGAGWLYITTSFENSRPP